MSGPNPKTGFKTRYVCAHITAIGSATLPVGSIYAAASSGFNLLETGAWSSSSSAKNGRLRRLTTTGTPGAGQTEVRYDPSAVAPSATVFNTHTVAPTLGDALRVFRLLAAAGIGIHYGFHGCPIEVKAGTANGIGWSRVDANTGGFEPVLWVWEE